MRKIDRQIFETKGQLRAIKAILMAHAEMKEKIKPFTDCPGDIPQTVLSEMEKFSQLINLYYQSADLHLFSLKEKKVHG